MTSVTMSTNAIAEKRILTAVVAHAVKDACIAPVLLGKVAVRPHADAQSAMNFFFNTKRSGIDAYAIWLEFDAERFREKLIQACFDNVAPKDLHLTDDQRRNFRANYKLFRNAPVLADEWTDDEEEE